MLYAILIGFGYLFVLGLFFVSPLICKLFLLALNAYIPDPIPFIDEIIMFFSTGMHLCKIMDTVDYIRDHKTVSKIIGVGAVVILVIAVKILFF